MTGTRTMMVGAVGSGKTHAIRTLIDAGLEVFVLFTEPGMETLSDIPSSKLHWHYIPPSAPSWDAMLDSASKINTLPFKSLTELGDINKRQYDEFLQIVKACSNFPDDRTGTSFGPIDSWGPDRAFVLDSLSGLNIAAMNLVAGSKPVKSMADWGVAMDNLERLITKLTTALNCHFVLTAHLEKEIDETTGAVSNMASTLGRKLAPRLPRFFGDVVMCKREGNQFFWSTADLRTDLKARNLPIGDKLPPSFVGLLNTWKSRQAVPAVPAAAGNIST